MDNNFFEDLEKNNNLKKEMKVKQTTNYTNENYQRKSKKNTFVGFVLIIIGIVSLIWGIGLNYSGISSTNKSYGGDAYTGIQNASSRTANNINELGYTVCYGLKGILVVMGSTIIASGIYILQKKETE